MKAAILARIPAADLDDARDVDMVIEAVTENVRPQAAGCSRSSMRIRRPSAILATNTSSHLHHRDRGGHQAARPA